MEQQTRYNEYSQSLSQLMSGGVTPSRIIGRGYKNPKSVASGWLRTQLHNLQNPNQQVTQIHVASSGKAFRTERKAMQSKVYQVLLANDYTTINGSEITDYGVIPSVIGDGYEIYVITQYRKA